MNMILKNRMISMLILWLTCLFVISPNAIAGDWQIIKASGDAWVKTEGPKYNTIQKGQTLKNGEQIHTGTNGRVLLQRGEERILISPNSFVGLPLKSLENGKTKIFQHQGQIKLDVEKKNVKHFEVVTPYLAAVVKGTEFTVDVDDKNTAVSVHSGKVEVSDFKTGQFVEITKRQTAKIYNNSSIGITLQGDGPKATIKQGKPRKLVINPISSEKLRYASNTILENNGRAPQANYRSSSFSENENANFSLGSLTNTQTMLAIILAFILSIGYMVVRGFK